MSKTACVYHSIDLDGFMSAAIVKHWFNETNFKEAAIGNTLPDNIDFVGYNYGQPIPDLSKYDKVIMCDVSFPVEEMDNLNYRLRDNFIWIDHHVSAIDGNYEYHEGIRDTKFAACELTWFYFFPNEEMPEIVRLLGRYDCFGSHGTDEEQKVLEFQYGARSIITNYEEAYRELCDNIYCEHTELGIWNKGRDIYKYLCVEAKQVYKNGFVIEFPYVGVEINNEQIILKHTFICINKERFNPINFGIDYHKEGYDGCACFHYANGVWNFSLYSQTVDCSQIAKQYGGGGHRGSSGMRLNNTQFLQLING